MSDDNKKYIIHGPSLGFCGVLSLIFITLKLTHVIDWSWWLVLLPLYGPVCLVFGVFLFIIALIFIFDVPSRFR